MGSNLFRSDSVSTKREERFLAFSMAEALDNQGLQVAASFSSNHYGWDGWIRTIAMTESKSVALPLGYTPI